jgi:hypothetical protein
MIHRDNITLVAAIASSLGLHFFLLPVVYATNRTITSISPTESTHLETPTVEHAEIDLGIDDSKESSLTWIGYNEYKEHLARHSEVEQAEMQSELADARSAVAMLKKLAQPMAEMSSHFFEAIKKVTITFPSKELPPNTQAQEKVITEEVALETSVEKNQLQQILSDRDAEATSVIRVSEEEWRIGKPLAGQGIVLKPKKPTFFPNQLIATRPRNVVADLSIDRTGKPIFVVLLYATGGVSIDRAIENSLYRWRASGEQIEALKGEETVKSTIHLLFSH